MDILLPKCLLAWIFSSLSISYCQPAVCLPSSLFACLSDILFDCLPAFLPCLPVNLSVCHFCPKTRLSACLSESLSAYLSTSLYFLPACPPACLSPYLFASASACLACFLPVCLQACLPLPVSLCLSFIPIACLPTCNIFCH